MEAHLRFYKTATVILLAVVVLLSAILIFGGRRKFARGIKINDELVCLVKNQEAAREVHERLLEKGKGELPGEAALEEQWEDEPWPVDSNEILSVQEAVQALNEYGVTVLVDAYTIEVDGNPTVILRGKDMAEDVLDDIKAGYVPEGEKLVEPQTFLEEVRIAPRRANASEVITEISAAVKALSKTRTEAKSYTVQSGDYPEKIAADHGMSIAAFYELNSQTRGSTIHPGDKVKVAPAVSGLTVKSVTEVSETVEVEPEVEKVYSASLSRGETRVASEGTPGKKLVVKHRTYHNDRLIEEETKKSEIVESPSPKQVLVGTGDTPAAGGDDEGGGN